MKKDEPVFPNQVLSSDWKEKTEWYDHYQLIGGLTKREYFAGLAMQGMIAGITKFKQHEIVDGPLCLDEPDLIIVNRTQSIAEISKTYADALIKELEDKDENE